MEETRSDFEFGELEREVGVDEGLEDFEKGDLLLFEREMEVGLVHAVLKFGGKVGDVLEGLDPSLSLEVQGLTVRPIE